MTVNRSTRIYAPDKITPPDADTYCIKEPEEDIPTVVPGPPSVLETVTSCPQEYLDESEKTRWTINASKTCEVKVTALDRFGISPTNGACYDVSFIKSPTESRLFQKICELFESLSF